MYWSENLEEKKKRKGSYCSQFCGLYHTGITAIYFTPYGRYFVVPSASVRQLVWHVWAGLSQAVLHTGHSTTVVLIITPSLSKHHQTIMLWFAVLELANKNMFARLTNALSRQIYPKPIWIHLILIPYSINHGSLYKKCENFLPSWKIRVNLSGYNWILLAHRP